MYPSGRRRATLRMLQQLAQEVRANSAVWNSGSITNSRIWTSVGASVMQQ
jgi:hypothetical protein